MPSTSPPPGPDTPAGPPLKDEQALERLFRARYQPLTREARTHLKDAEAAAPRIVEALFLRAWDQRTEFKSSADVDAFFAAELPHAAARELARRASAHHFGAQGGKHAAARAEPAGSVDESWDRIHRTLHPDHAATSGAIKEHSRHDAAAHVKGLAKKRNYVIPGVIVVLSIAAALGISKYLNRLGEEGGVISALKANETKAHLTRDNQIAKVALTEGSAVKLAPDSKLVVADEFSGDKMRVIQLQGAAQVDVSAGQSAPFQIRAFSAVVNAPSGSVIIRTYDDDSSVTLIAKGDADSLRVGKLWRPMAAGAALHVSRDGTVGDATPGQFLEASTWVDDTVSVANRTLKEAVDQLRAWYGTKVVVLDSSLLTRPVTMQASLNSATDAIAAIEKSANVKFGYEGQGMVFRDAAQKK
jgi:transmembrane sensor